MGLADPAWTTHDLLLMQHMVYGVAIAQVDPARAPSAVHRALELIDVRLVPGQGEGAGEGPTGPPVRGDSGIRPRHR